MILLQIAEADIVGKIIEHSPLVATLVWIIWRDTKKVKYLENENRELHDYIRESEKSTIGYIKDVNNNLEKIADKMK